VSCPVGPLVISASDFSSWPGRTTKSHWAVRRGGGRRQGGKGPLKYEHDLPDRTLGRQRLDLTNYHHEGSEVVVRIERSGEPQHPFETTSMRGEE